MLKAPDEKIKGRDEVIGVSGFIKPGDHVDVMVTIEADARRQHPVAKLILENLKVLAAGMQYEKNGSEKDPKPVFFGDRTFRYPRVL